MSPKKYVTPSLSIIYPMIWYILHAKVICNIDWSHSKIVHINDIVEIALFMMLLANQALSNPFLVCCSMGLYLLLLIYHSFMIQKKIWAYGFYFSIQGKKLSYGSLLSYLFYRPFRLYKYAHSFLRSNLYWLRQTKYVRLHACLCIHDLHYLHSHLFVHHLYLHYFLYPQHTHYMLMAPCPYHLNHSKTLLQHPIP